MAVTLSCPTPSPLCLRYHCTAHCFRAEWGEKERKREEREREGQRAESAEMERDGGGDRASDRNAFIESGMSTERASEDKRH